ncbi:MAG: TraR/DksA family transcriptional regulator [bacterium]
MKKEELQYFKILLEQKRDEMIKDLGQLKSKDATSTLKDSSGENSAYSYHMADVGTDNMEREKAFFFATREGRFLYHLEQALERIEKGTYGYCQECEKPISKERLEAVPHARLCITCKSKEEKGQNNSR